jgi:hypothetical protein
VLIRVTTLVFGIVACAIAPSAEAGLQPPSDAATNQETVQAIHELRLKDGSKLYGYLEPSTPDQVVFRTITGTTVQIERAQIASIEPARGRLVDGQFLPADANPTRLFFAPTGRSVARGEGYVGVYELVLPFVQVGLTDRISIGAGTPLFFGGGTEHPFWVTPKVQVLEQGPASVAVGILHFMNVGDGNFGIAYAVTTYGGPDAAVTGGVGYAYARYDRNTDASMIGMLGGEYRIGRRLKFITENYLWQGAGIISGGVRFLGERLSADIGLFAPVGSDTAFAAPVVNVVWKF